MRIRRTWSRGAAALLSSGFVLAASGIAAPTVLADPGPLGPVAAIPAQGTPSLGPSGTTEQIRQLTACGGTMYAVGSFTEISQNGVTYPVSNVISFSETAPYTLNSWAPAVNGTVNTIGFASGNCADAYIGGNFSSVGGVPAKDIAEIDTTTGQLVPTFETRASGQIETILGYNNHLLVGGYFKTINGNDTDHYMASLDPVTGKDDGFIQLNISGNYQFPGSGTNPTRVYNQQLSHGGTLDLVEGDFTSVGGQGRQQIFMLDLSGATAQVTGWSSPEWDGSQGNLPFGYPYQCHGNEAFYLQAASWSADDSTIYIATTGYHPWNLQAGSYPRSGLCDAAAAFPSTQTEVTHLWVNYTGCDSLYSTAADASTAYFGGHERWSTNANGCDYAGPDAISAPGMEGLSPAGGDLTFNPTRARGLGADDMLVTDQGLWIGSDNLKGANRCGNRKGYSGICLLPYSS
jgi:hypothetical protein